MIPYESIKLNFIIQEERKYKKDDSNFYEGAVVANYSASDATVEQNAIEVEQQLTINADQRKQTNDKDKLMISTYNLDELRGIIINENYEQLLTLYDSMIDSTYKIKEYESSENSTYTYEEAYGEVLAYLEYKYGTLDDALNYEVVIWSNELDETKDEDLISIKDVTYHVIYDSIEKVIIFQTIVLNNRRKL